MFVECETCHRSFKQTAQRLRSNKRHWCCRECWLSRSRLSKENNTLYQYWYSLKSRCHNPEYHHFHLHGAKGFSMCLAWKKFDPFCLWSLENNWVPGSSLILRVGCNKYSPETCYWAPETVLFKKIRKEIKYKIRIGDRFGNLTVVGEKYCFNKKKNHDQLFKYCLCDCGEYVLVLSQRLVIGNAKYCKKCYYGKTSGWSRDHSCCKNCRSTKNKHSSHGLCVKCQYVTRTLPFWRKELLAIIDSKLMEMS